jgi:RNA polymerase sigma-70 factor (ECF subfamily)
LLTSAAAGNKVAFSRLYERYERRVFNYVRGLVKQPALAEDVTIEAMIAIWDGARRFGGASRVSTWIFGIARHKAIDALRKRGNRLEAAPMPSDIELASEDDPELDVERIDDASAMAAAIARLSSEHQEILRLAFFEDLPYGDIAKLLDIPDNTVKTRVYYAKRQLKRHLATAGIGAAR